MVSATPFSSPKLGSITSIPSIILLLDLNKFAHFSASWKVSTPPSLVSDSDNKIGLMLCFLNILNI